MIKSIKPYLRDLLTELDDIVRFTAAGRQNFMTDSMVQKAVIRSYEVIGEIVKRLPPTVRDANPQINWRQLITFRDFLAHNYDVVVLKNIWVAIEDAPNLKAAVEAMLAALPEDDTPENKKE